MVELLIRHGEWVVVCDGAKALILENAGDTRFPNLKTIKVLEQRDLPTHALHTDAPAAPLIPSAVRAVRSSKPIGTTSRSGPSLFILRSNWTALLRPGRPSLSLWWRHHVRWA